jgi:hypothetical protein
MPAPRNSSSWLKTALARAPSVPGGLMRISYPIDLVDIRRPLIQHIVDGGFTPNPLPLDTLHYRVSPEHRRTDERSLNALSVRLRAAPRGMLEAYLRLIRYLAHEVLQLDVLFEANPFVRFYFPGPALDGYRFSPDLALSYHSDTLFGDAFEQINCWLPLGRSCNTSTLQCASFPSSIEMLTRFADEINFDSLRFVAGRDLFFRHLCNDPSFRADVMASCSPMNMDYGEVLVFDARTIHGTLDNCEDQTRISIDFRLLPVSAYWDNRAQRIGTSRGVAHRLRGQYWDSRRAFDL